MPDVVGIAGTLPANAPGFFLDYRIPAGLALSGTPSVEVEVGDQPLATSLGAPTAFASFRAATLDLSALAGSTLSIRAYAPCSNGPVGTPLAYRDVAVTIGPSRPLPTSLGTLSVMEVASEEVPLPGGSGCFEIDARPTVHVSLEPSADMLPWLDFVALETWVDGAPFARRGTIGEPYGWIRDAGTSSLVGRGEDLFYATCGLSDVGEGGGAVKEEGLSEGAHSVMLRATMADGTTLETAPVTIEVRCPTKGGAGCAASGTRDGSMTSLLLLVGMIAVRLGSRRRG